MIVSGFERKRIGFRTEFSAVFCVNGVEEKIWFSVKTKFASFFFPYNSFFVVVYPMALALNEKLIFEGPVSKKLFRNIRKISPFLGFDNREIEVIFKGWVTDKGKYRKRGLLFTLGLDSFHALLSMKREKKGIDALVFVIGYDIHLSKDSFIKKVNKKLIAVSRIFNVDPIVVSTNLRSYSDPILRWSLFHGAALGAVGHLLKEIGYFYVASSDQYLDKGVLWGTGPKLDRLWSSEKRRFIPFAPKSSRMQKIDELVGDSCLETLLTNLRVCWQHDIPAGKLNCGECEKCIRTHLMLLLCGLEVPKDLFGNFSLKKLKTVSLTPEKYKVWEPVYRRIIESKGFEKEIKSEVARIVGKTL